YLLCQQWEKGLALKDSAGDISGWSETHVKQAIESISAFHAEHISRADEHAERPWLQPFASPVALARTKAQNEIITDAAAHFFKDWIDPEDLAYHRELVATVEAWSAPLGRLPHTLVHHDYNPRNLAFRADGSLCVFDWELATIHLPQRDTVELLAFVLSGQVPVERAAELLEHHRLALQAGSGTTLRKSEWVLGASIAIKEFIYSRLSMYFVAHAQRHCDFIQRTYRTAIAISKLLDKEVQDGQFDKISQ
ncbi:MAG TPA: phosphotransferase, partial [Bdellovibrionales bacterium]|nr:phosphotransferase [Bdellovibrionales bacterium]